MSENIDPKKQWYVMLTHMLEDFRINHPNDPREDIEIINDLMEYFVETGKIKKKDGKYILPKLTDNA